MSARLVIIDDEPAILRMYQNEFTRLGYEVATAVDGPTGLQLIQSSHPDLVLLDLNLPNMNGAEVLTQLRSQDWGKDTKVIVLTNQDRVSAPEAMDQLGISRYIVKVEYSPEQLAAAVKEVLG